jgi:alkylation response protein AidB-like acyl-CoA dehydrogenase
MKLNQECTLLQNELKKFAQQVILDRVDEFEQTCSMPFDNIKQLGEMGILGALIPEELNGAALDTIGTVVSLEELSKVCASTGLIITVHNAFFAYPILKFGSDEMKKKYLPKAALGEIIGAYAEFSTHEVEIEKQGSDFVINGRNPFVLNGAAKGPVLAILSTDRKNNALSGFIIDPDNPGLKITGNSSAIGVKSAGISEVVFENCRLAQDAIISAENQGEMILEDITNTGRILLAAINLGIAQGALDNAIKYAKERIQFKEAIINFGMVREKIADAVTRIESVRLLTYDAALKRDNNEDFSIASSIAKYYSGLSAVEITNQAIQIYGGYGYMKDYPVERYFRDAQVINVIGSTPVQEKENIVRKIIG